MTLDELQNRVAAGEAFEYLFFWGHSQKDGLTKACFSQWYPASFMADGITYPTAEHWMMAEKARLFDDQATLALILEAKTPNDAKSLGRRIKPFIHDRWVDRRFDAVVEGNLAKFGQNKDLLGFLVGTGDKILVEASPNDAIWGIGMSESDPAALSPLTWKGINLLGFALMEVRASLGA
jgi:ribA/ribD-fused uncharacterized protein